MPDLSRSNRLASNGCLMSAMLRPFEHRDYQRQQRVDRRHRRHLASGPATKVPLEPAGIRVLAGQLGDLSRAAPFLQNCFSRSRELLGAVRRPRPPIV